MTRSSCITCEPDKVWICVVVLSETFRPASSGNRTITLAVMRESENESKSSSRIGHSDSLENHVKGLPKFNSCLSAVRWGRTVSMNTSLCEKYGNGAFPSPSNIASITSEALQASCGVGYRAKSIVALAKQVLLPCWHSCFPAFWYVLSCNLVQCSSCKTAQMTSDKQWYSRFRMFSVITLIRIGESTEHYTAHNELRSIITRQACRLTYNDASNPRSNL